MALACSGWGSGAQQTLTRNGVRLWLDFAVMELPDTLLGFETTSPSSLRPVVGGTGGDTALRGGFGCRFIFGGGVWCLICG
jgi:hypothetical protein